MVWYSWLVSWLDNAITFPRDWVTVYKMQFT